MVTVTYFALKKGSFFLIINLVFAEDPTFKHCIVFFLFYQLKQVFFRKTVFKKIIKSV